MDTNVGNRQVLPAIAGMISGVSWGQTFIAEDVLPPVNTYAEEYVYETWGNEGLEDVGNIERGLNGETAKLNPPQNSSVKGSLAEHALETLLDYRLKKAAENNDRLRAAYSATAPNGLSAVDSFYRARALRLQYAIQIQKEKKTSAIVFNTTNYDSALWYGTGGGGAAVDFSASGIIPTIMLVKRAVAARYGFAPDTLVLGYQKFVDLWHSSDILARTTGGATTLNPAEINEALVARLLGVRRLLVGAAISQPNADLAANAMPGGSTPTDLWTSTTAALIYSGEPELADLASPAFAKMFYMEVPETATRYNLQTWMSGNNKIEHMEATEFFKPAQVMKSGAIFTV